MWIPRDPEVFGQPMSPTASSASRSRHRNVADLRPLDAGHRVEIDPQLIGMVEVVGADGMRVQIDTAEVHDPRQSRRLVHDDLVGGSPRGECQFRGPDPVGRVVRRSLLEERLFGDPVHEPLEGHGPAADAGQRAVGDGEVVLDEVELGVSSVGEVHLLRIGDRDLVAADLEDLLGRRHGDTIPLDSHGSAGDDATAVSPTVDLALDRSSWS